MVLSWFPKDQYAPTLLHYIDLGSCVYPNNLQINSPTNRNMYWELYVLWSGSCIVNCLKVVFVSGIVFILTVTSFYVTLCLKPIYNVQYTDTYIFCNVIHFESTRCFSNLVQNYFLVRKNTFQPKFSSAKYTEKRNNTIVALFMK